jgi:hypothetical protein
MYTNKTIPFLFTIALFICSCSNNQQTKTSNLKALNDSLSISNSELKKNNDSLYKILKQKLQDEKPAQEAVLWFAKAQYLQYRTAEIYKYLDSSITSLKNGSSLKSPDTLYEKLSFYKGKILRIDPDIYNVISKNSTLITHYFDSVKNTGERFDLFFAKKSSQEQLLILNQTLNYIEAIENETLLFCNSKVKVN